MTDKEKLQKIKHELEVRLDVLLERRQDLSINQDFLTGSIDAYEALLRFLNSLLYEPKFKVGDKLISTKNPHLTYDVLEVGHVNVLGNIEYKVEIFEDGKSGIQFANTFEEHNIQLIECKKIDKWAQLISEHNFDLEEEIKKWIRHYINVLDNNLTIDLRDIDVVARHFAKWQKKKDQEEMLKGAVLETKVMMDCDGDGIDTPYEEWLTLENTEIPFIPNNFGLKEGDKVKIIIVKED